VTDNMRDGAEDNPRKATLVFKGRTLASRAQVLITQNEFLRRIKEMAAMGGGGGMKFAPVINIQGSADRSMVEEALAEAQARFEAWYLQMQRRQARTAY